MTYISTHSTYHGSSRVYVYECDVCGKDIHLGAKKDLVKCEKCGKKLCPACARFAVLCAEHFAALSPQGQDDLRKIDEKYRPSETKKKKLIASWCGVWILTIVVGFINVLDSISLVMQNGGHPLAGPINWGLMMFLIVGFIGGVAFLIWGMTFERYTILKKSDRLAVVHKYMA